MCTPLRVYLCLLLIPVFFFSACRNRLKDLEIPRWETNIVAPLVSTKLSITDLVPDSLMKVNTDSSLSIVYQQNIIDLSLDSLLKIPDTTVVKTVKLDSLKLENKTIVNSISLGDVALGCGCLAGFFILANNDSMRPVTALADIPSGDIEIDGTSFFETATISSGTLTLDIENHFPVPLTNVRLKIKNKVNGVTIIEDTIALIDTFPIPFDSIDYDLSGKQVEGHLVADIILDSPGSGGDSVLIDTSDAVIITMRIKNIKVSEATAIFPTQTAVKDTSTVEYDMGDARLVKVVVKSGMIEAKVVSTIQENMNVFFAIPDAVNTIGDTAKVNVFLPPAPLNGSVSQTETVDLKGFTIRLDNTKQGYNSFNKSLICGIVSSGQQHTITLDDSIYVYYALKDIVPQYVEGYLGRDTLTLGPESVDLSFFRIFRDGLLDLSDPRMDIVINNSVGVTAILRTDTLRAENEGKGTYVDMTGPSVGMPFDIGGPTLDQVGQTVTTTLSFNKNNSNIRDALKVFPSRFSFSGEGIVNYVYHTGDPVLMNNFATDSSRFRADAEISIPLSASAKDLVLSDTLAFGLNKSNVGKRVKEGTFRLIVNSRFPVDARLQAYFTDSTNQVVDSLFADDASGTIQAAPVDGNGKVTVPKKSVLSSYCSPERMDRIRKAATIVVQARLNSVPPDVHLKIYNTYGIDLSLVGDFIYYTK